MEKRKPERERANLFAKELYTDFSAAILPLVVKDKNGDHGIGSAFHVGDGSFVTARHVMEGKAECSVEIDSYRHHRWLRQTVHFQKPDRFELVALQPLFHPDSKKDVAVFSVPSLSDLPGIPLGGHLDDWINDEQFVLNEVLVLGFPPIPLAKSNILVTSRGQINAVVDLTVAEHVHFIVSTMARGGFSGGVVLSEWGVAMGMVTSSLLKNDMPEELGYLTVLSVEPILECLGAHMLLPSEDAALWDDLFDPGKS
ncbi:S1 family peptidase [Pseudorhodobacter wandonensis]|uniref:S1 family peptidase n=1 Tax=Pseudorhodobacter wandonensis TaxID=1120568 RepID=UPI00067C4DB7|nr:serine protease [Pseudorhodobacter wandonensis]